MTSFFLFTLFFLALLIPAYLYRALIGPTVFDRLIGLNGIASKAILFLVLLGAYERNLDMLLDIGLGYALLNLVGALAVGKYLEKRGVAK